MPEKPRRLGRGLEALIGASALMTPPSAQAVAANAGVQRIPIADIRANPFQPRKEFSSDELGELENSIRSHGLLQPVTVRPAANGGFELVAGERRLRAVTRLGWPDIPAQVRQLDDRALLTLALVENLQRADLNPIEEALGFQQLIDEFKLTQQDVANTVGKNRSTVANAVRLLALPSAIRQLLHDGQLTSGHARALLTLSTERAMLDMAREIVARQLTVRDVERQVKSAAPGTRKQRAPETTTSHSSREAEIRRLSDMLRRHLQTDVQLVVDREDKGEIRIAFFSAADLERVLDLITARAGEGM